MQFVKLLFIFITTAVLFSGCQPQVTGGGSGTETINAYVCFSDGKPAKGANVKIIDALGWMDSVRRGSDGVIKYAVADSYGKIELPVQDSNLSLNLQIDHSDEGVFVNLGKNNIRDMDTFRLKAYSTYKAFFDSSSGEVGEILLSGSSYRSQSLKDGTFVFDKVAPSVFSVIGISRKSALMTYAVCGSVSLASGKTTSEKLLNKEFNRTLLDDFGYGTVGPSCIGKIIPTVNWYAVSDSSLILWNDDKRCMDVITNDTSYMSHTYMSMESVVNKAGSRSMRFISVLDTGSGGSPYAITGLSVLKVFENGIDLSQMKSISFKAQGKGTVWVRIEAKTLIDSTTGNFTCPVQLTESLTDYCITVDQLRIMPEIENAYRYSWAAESKKILNIEFEFNCYVNPRGDTLSMIIDDLYLDNVGIDVFK